MEKTKVYVGIDPGKDGAICNIINGDVNWHVIPLIGKVVDISQLAKDLTLYKRDDYDVTVVLEDVHALFNVSANNTFQLGHVVGLIEGVLAALQLPYIKVAPKKWQALVFQGVPLQTKPSTTGKSVVNDTKAMALIAVSRLFPEIDKSRFERPGTRTNKIHDGIVDAVCMAYYCRHMRE